jgi:hypothetical protein
MLSPLKINPELRDKPVYFYGMDNNTMDSARKYGGWRLLPDLIIR